MCCEWDTAAAAAAAAATTSAFDNVEWFEAVGVDEVEGVVDEDEDEDDEDDDEEEDI